MPMVLFSKLWANTTHQLRNHTASSSKQMPMPLFVCINICRWHFSANFVPVTPFSLIFHVNTGLKYYSANFEPIPLFSLISILHLIANKCWCHSLPLEYRPMTPFNKRCVSVTIQPHIHVNTDRWYYSANFEPIPPFNLITILHFL